MISSPYFNSLLAVAELTPARPDQTDWASWLFELVGISNKASAIRATLSPKESQKETATLAQFRSVLSGVTAGERIVTTDQRLHPVAIFGVSSETTKLREVAAVDLKITCLTSVDTFNWAIGILYEIPEADPRCKSWEGIFSVYLDNILQIDNYSSDLASSRQAASDDALQGRSSSAHLSPDHIAWKKYLFDNKEKLDPLIRIKKIRSARAKGGRQDTIHGFILKNGLAKGDDRRLASQLVYLIESLGCSTSAALKDALSDYKTLHGVSFFTESDFENLTELYQNHFFRNTSKLGLTFFAKSGYDILFSWNVSKDTKIDLDVANVKPWKEKMRRFGSYEPITLSELRCLQRNEQVLFNKGSIFTSFINKDLALVSKSFKQQQWIEITSSDAVAGVKP